MTKDLQVTLAVKALIAAALPALDDQGLRGFDQAASELAVVPATGMVMGLPSNPGDPQVDLGPLSYTYDHGFPIEVSANEALGGLSLDAMLLAIGVGISADRYLGGLCDWLEATKPIREDRTSDEVTIRWAEFTIVATYSTPDPLA